MSPDQDRPFVSCENAADSLFDRNLAITPSKARGMSTEELKKVCHDYTINGLDCMAAVANLDHPFRFIYTSGAMTERDQDRQGLWLIPEYRKMRVSLVNILVSDSRLT